MNTEIIDAGRDINGGYKVDVSRGSNVDPVSSGWFSRTQEVTQTVTVDALGQAQT